MLLAAAIVAQVAVPLVALAGSPAPTRFGFQMYSSQGYVRVDVRDAAGEKIPVDLEDHVAGVVRPDLDWTGALPEQLCAAVSGAATVNVRQPEQKRTVRC